jgi:integrase/recombinase XerD
MATDFAVFLRRFLNAHLAELRGCSPNTVASYRDTFKLLIVFFRDNRSIPPEKLTLDCIDTAAITGFLNWLEASRHSSVSTRNQRLAAIGSFYRWMQSQDPAQMACCQDILAIPAEKQTQPAVNHLTVEQTRAVYLRNAVGSGTGAVVSPGCRSWDLCWCFCRRFPGRLSHPSVLGSGSWLRFQLPPIE